MKEHIKILGSKKQRVTKQRILVLDVLKKAGSPVSVKEISEKVNGKMNLSTVYRNLIELEKSKIVSRVNIDKDMSFFEFRNKEDDHHHHIVCSGCKKIEEVQICEIDNYLKKVLSRSKNFKKLSSHSLELFGTCKKCATK